MKNDNPKKLPNISIIIPTLPAEIRAFIRNFKNLSKTIDAKR